MLDRKIEADIATWLKKSRNALLIQGARQVGKTFAIRKALKDSGIEWSEFNLIEEPRLIPVLQKSTSADDLIAGLSLFSSNDISNVKVVFIDEVQEYPDIMTKLKFWVDDGCFRFILSGSLLGIELKSIRSAPVGYLEILTMHPMDFEEFLQLYNFSQALKITLKKCFQDKVPVPDGIHEKLIDIFHAYLNVGGMPEAVDAFQKTRNLNDVMRIHKAIIDLYHLDFTKYESEDKKLLLARAYDLIPAELNNPNKRFSFSSIKDGLSYGRVEDSFLWLNSAGVSIPVYNVVSPEVPLILNEKRNLFKLFPNDIGLLTSMLGKDAKIAIASGDISINCGSIYECVVAEELNSHGFHLFFYNSKKYGEIDFVIEMNGKAVPIEVKSGKAYKKHSALDNVLSIPNFDIDEAIVFSEGNIHAEEKITYYPIFMIMLLDNASETLPVIDIPGF